MRHNTDMWGNACTFGSWHVWSTQASFLLPRIGQPILAWPNIDMCYFLTHYSRLILATGWIELYTCPVETTRPEQSNVRCGKRCKWYTDGRPAGNLMLKWCELMSVWWLLTPVSNQPAGTDTIELLGLQRLLSLHTRHLLQPSVTHLLTHWVRHHCMLAPSQQLLQISVWILWTATLRQ